MSELPKEDDYQDIADQLVRATRTIEKLEEYRVFELDRIDKDMRIASQSREALATKLSRAVNQDAPELAIIVGSDTAVFVSFRASGMTAFIRVVPISTFMGTRGPAVDRETTGEG